MPKCRSRVGVPRILSQPVLHILLIEDNPGDAELVKAALAEAAGAEFQIHHAEALAPGLDRLMRGDIDLVLLDVSLPDSHGLDGLNAVRILAPSIPVVLLTGWDSGSLCVAGGAKRSAGLPCEGHAAGAGPGSHPATGHCPPEDPRGISGRPALVRSRRRSWPFSASRGE